MRIMLRFECKNIIVNVVMPDRCSLDKLVHILLIQSLSPFI